MEKLKNDLGNLAPWGYSPNRGSQNAPFYEKRELYVQSDMAMTRDVGKKTGWTAKRIEARQTQLIDWALKFYALSDEAKKAAEEQVDQREELGTRAPTAWVVRLKDVSKDVDQLYEYKKGSKHGRLVKGRGKYTLEAGDVVMYLQPKKKSDPAVCGVGRVARVDIAGDTRSVHYDWYHTIDPPLGLGEISVTQPKVPNVIQEVPQSSFEAVLSLGKIDRPSKPAGSD